MVAFPSFSIADLPEFGAVPRFNPDELDVDAIEFELASLPHLDGDRRFEDPPTIERLFKTETAETAVETLGRIPGPNEAFHLVINGRFALWDFVVAVLQIAGDLPKNSKEGAVTITNLYLATLGFSRKNITELSLLLDAGRIRSVSLLCSHYFKGTSNGIYEFAVEELSKRQQRFASVRTHAKVVLVRLSDDRTVAFESSANLRSCKNIEQVSVYGSPDLYRFHARWMEELFS